MHKALQASSRQSKTIPLSTLIDKLRFHSGTQRTPTSRDLLTGPIRGELYGAEHLGERAREVAADQVLATDKAAHRAPLLARLAQTTHVLADAHAQLAAISDRQEDVSPAGDWLLDNYFVLRETIEEVRESLPRSYYRELPTLASGPLAGYPRAYEIAITLISHTEGRLDRGNVSAFVTAFQSITPLTLGELWAIPAMLRLGLIENVRRMALRTTQRHAEITRADADAARITRAAAVGGSALERELATFTAAAPTLSDTFVARFLQQLRVEGGALPAVVRLQLWIAEEALSAEDATARATQKLALTQVMMAHSITSLRAIAQIDWRDFLEQMSHVEAVLRAEPTGHYPRMTFATRDSYRHVVERIARRTGRPETAVAQAAVALAQVAVDTPHAAARTQHVGYYLVDDGVLALEQATGYRPPFGETVGRVVHRHPTYVYLSALGLTMLGALAAILWLGGTALAGHWIAVLLLGAIPASELAVTIVNRVVTALRPPRTLPRLDLHTHGVPPEWRTAVVIPTLFASVEAVGEALQTLEVQFLANREEHLHFAVLSDFTDAHTSMLPTDAAIVAAAVAGVEALNARYAPEAGDVFFLFHRPRLWNAQQGVWMGWERKRGKLGEFNRFVLTGERAGFSDVVGAVDILREVRFVITLDADTVLPPDAAPALIGALAHPLNRPVFDPARSRIVRGHGILQPRVGVSLPSAYRSRFAAVYSGHPGVDPYTTAVSDVYQDLFGEGSFTGKGIYDVEAFEQATHGRFPENTLLSHDLIEGNYARAGLAADVIVYDDYPSQYRTFSRRKHRWIRGDWQLLPWVLGAVPGPQGPERNRLSLLSRWKIVDNLRRSVVEIAQLLFLLVGWALLPVSAWRWTLLGLALIAAPWIVSLVLQLLGPPFDRSLRAYYRAVRVDARTSLWQVLLAVTFLPHQAWLSLDAIVRTTWRLFVSRRQMLEWQTAQSAERAASGSSRAAWAAMWPVSAAAALVLLWSLSALQTAAMPTVLLTVLIVWPVLGLWIASPSIAHALSTPRVPESRVLSSANAEHARRYAALHWQFFDTFVTAESAWLAPDNFQASPDPVVALRTSPTNIGLQLLSVVSAHDLGFITQADLIGRLQRAAASMQRLPRWHGHYYNWYDLRDLSVLEPAYVSTVDSGNLAGHLIALRQACRQLAAAAATEPADRDALEALAAWAHDVVMAMDFSVLFDPERELFSIGRQQHADALDASSYDLLASEARLASFVAIAKDDVPVDHWFRLGRTVTFAAGAPALVSWSGSMFEYLMPSLVMQALPDTVLAQTYAGVIDRQVANGVLRDVPWGISESACNVRDRHLTYQYRPFGVPDLALKRDVGRELVIAPYATVLAVAVAPLRSFANLARLETLGALGPYGFRDALDYSRPDPGKRVAVVDAYFAHHIGMSLVALTNALLDDVWPRRFHADPLVISADLLLHERVPRVVVLQELRTGRPEDSAPGAHSEHPVVRTFTTADTPTPHVALLGHHPYTVMLTNAGAGYSRYEGLVVSRWRADGTRDATGQFCYVRDVSTDCLWSTSHQPTTVEADRYQAALGTDLVTFERSDGDIQTRTEITVVPEDSAEVRRVTLTNTGRTPREVELTSYGEIVLAPADADRAHPAFSNLFVETAWHPWCNAITATRRPRSATEERQWLVHVVDWGKERVGEVSWETDRARFIGRGRSTRDPIALEADAELSGSVGAVLDPIFAIRTRVLLPPGQSATVAFTTLVAASQERAFALADRYRDPHTAQRAFDLSWTASQVELRELDLTPSDAAVCQELAGHLLYGHPALRAPHGELQRNHGSQPLLWEFGVSGDLPILLATISSAEGLPTLRALLAAHRFWRRRGMSVDLVIVDEHAHTYLQDLGDRIAAAVHAVNDGDTQDRPGGVYVRRRELLTHDADLMLRASARLHIQCDGRALGRILATAIATGTPKVAELRGAHPLRTTRAGRPPVHPVSEAVTPQYPNGSGALTADGAYEIGVRGDAMPPAPWANVIANPHGGFVITERGGGFAWAASSYFYRLTPWHNDPVADPVSEALYLQDHESGDTWCATPAPIRTDTAYTVTHRAGSSTFAHRRHEIDVQYTVGMAEGRAVKVGLLRLTNTGHTPRRITITSYVEWVLGTSREISQHHVRNWFERERGTLWAQNAFDAGFAPWVAFSALTEPVAEHTGSRHTFLGRNGSVAAPAGMQAGVALSGVTGVGLDPCAALRCVIELAPGQSHEVGTLLGAAADEHHAQAALDALRSATAVREALGLTTTAWDHRLTAVTVHTPDPLFDAMLNRWSLYQALSCRMWGRSGLYQSGGAYGFRDQLQDVMAFVYADPAEARAHILRAAARQFVEGDVQHWWHPHTGRGVRTRFSDDLVWLPYVVDFYVRTTGDASILEEYVPFITMRALDPDEHEVYDLPVVTEEHASIYEHCRRALARATTRGAHGLPLIGGGDWNDGMNRVGVQGRGESVWLAWFLITTQRAFAVHADTRGDAELAVRLRRQAHDYADAVEAHGWDGDWYRRAYYDDGSSLGSHKNSECRIDSIAQSWSVISGAAPEARQASAMAAQEQYLVRNDERMLLLLTPAFDGTARDPGYIKGYLPGVRENGAQYTHAALWAAWATALRGDGQRAFELFQMINPLTHGQTPHDVATYKVEPYVVAADVYSAAGQEGRGGWTWYTGSASWMYRVGLEGILGFDKRGDTLTIAPRAPVSWPEYELRYRFGRSHYHITVRNSGGGPRGAAHITLDGVALDGASIPLVDDGATHHVIVEHQRR